MSADEKDVRCEPVLGCIADDVTGATDLAINLVQGGFRVVQFFAIPSAAELAEIDADAVVVGLKTRSVPPSEAVSATLQALDVLRDAGMKRFFFKYCSTFDSTAQGNIGPVAAALLEALAIPQTILCPAFPRGGRTVYQGHLFVHGMLLHESGMERHPLNPMTDANLKRWLEKQTDLIVGLLRYKDLAESAESRLHDLEQDGVRLVITDACDDAQLDVLANATTKMKLLTGGSGIARFLPKAYRTSGLVRSENYQPELPAVRGRGLILAGSCSSATNRQVARMKEQCPAFEVDPSRLISSSGTTAEAELERLLAWANGCDRDRPLLIYSTANPERVAELQNEYGGAIVAEAVEHLLASAAAPFGT